MKKIIFIVLLLCQAIIIGRTENIKRDNNNLVTSLEISNMKQSEFSVSNLYKYLQLIQVEDADVVIAQFVVETGWFKSKLFRIGNNICGMKKASKRLTTATGTMYGYASFNHWTDSVDDFKLWLQYHNLSKGYFKQIQKKNYSENSEYTTLVMKVHKKIVKDKLLV